LSRQIQSDALKQSFLGFGWMCLMNMPTFYVEMTACHYLAKKTFLDYIDFSKKRDDPRPVSPCWEQKPVKMDGLRRNGQTKLFSKI